MKTIKTTIRLVCLFLIQNFYVRGQPTSAPTSPGQKCPIPATFADKTVSYKCRGVTEKNCHKTGDTSVPQHTTAAFECNSGYFREDGKKFHSVCIDGEWEPPIDKCIKKCDKLKPVNVDLRCTYRGSSSECDENLLPGTKVHPTCAPLHTFENGTPAYQEIICKEDGKWDHPLFQCAPDCGKPFANAQLLIAFGEPEKYGDSPWNVAIYNAEKILICSGSIISPHLIVSVAHCFYDGEHDIKPDDFEVIVGKVTRNYTTKDNGNQKTYKIKEIRLPKKGFSGLTTHYQNDIALLVLNEEITMGATAMPVCVDWSGKKKIPSTEGTSGKLVGWGRNEHGKFDEILKTAKFSFVSHYECLKLIKDDNKQFLASDKFCALGEKGAEISVGDTGAGLVFLENDRYFIRGIASLRVSSNSKSGMYTDLHEHIDWIVSVRNEVEEHVIVKQTKIDFKNKS